MMNKFLLRAKWTRKARKAQPPAEKIPLVPRGDDVPVSLAQYFAGHVHLARLWAERLWFETEWFLASLRGELPPVRQMKNYTILHVTLPPQQYFLALEALTTRMGVKPKDAQPR